MFTCVIRSKREGDECEFARKLTDCEIFVVVARFL